MMPHHPTTAELAHLRAGLMSAPSIARATPHSDWYRTWRDERGWATHPGTDTPSWPHERAWGIGYRRLPDGFEPEYQPDASRMMVRREASALRSRAFARIAHEALGDAGLMLDLDAAMQTFEPMPATTQED